MALNQTSKHLCDLLCQITNDLTKADKGNKAASQRVRTGTVRLEKVAKLFRKESIKSEKSTKGHKKTAKKSGGKAKTGKVKTHSKAKSHRAKPRALRLRRPTAKLPRR